MRYTGAVQSTFFTDLLSWVIPVGLFVLLWSFLGRRMRNIGGWLMQIGKSKARIYVEANTGVTFDDVAGATRRGMSETLGHVVLDRDRRTFLAPNLPGEPQARDYSEVTAAAVDAQVRRIIDDAFERTTALLRERCAARERAAHRLLETETLSGRTFGDGAAGRCVAASEMQ